MGLEETSPPEIFKTIQQQSQLQQQQKIKKKQYMCLFITKRVEKSHICMSAETFIHDFFPRRVQFSVQNKFSV